MKNHDQDLENIPPVSVGDTRRGQALPANQDVTGGAATAKQIRLLNGPLRGGKFELNGRILIGRDDCCDIQLPHNGVSRQHACIMLDSSGNHVLVDLSSTNGTFIRSRRVTHVVLQAGSVIEIMPYRLIYEDVGAEATAADLDSDLGVLPGMRKTVVVECDRRVDGDELAAKPLLRSPSPMPSDSPTYAGDLFGDVAKYRTLRTRRLRGEPQCEADRFAFEALHKGMRSRGLLASSERPTYQRFPCRAQGVLRNVGGEEMPVDVVELGVDGARIHFEPSHDPGSLGWLVLQSGVGSHARTLVFASRVVPVGTGRADLGFVGAPDTSRRAVPTSRFSKPVGCSVSASGGPSHDTSFAMTKSHRPGLAPGLDASAK